MIKLISSISIRLFRIKTEMTEKWSDLLPLSLDKMDRLKHDLIESKQMFLFVAPYFASQL